MFLPRLYAIVDSALFTDDATLFAFSAELVAGGVTLLQYRNKQEGARRMLEQARELRELFPAGSSSRRVRLIMNDRADLCLAADLDGVHVGQDDLSPQGARLVVGPQRWVGVSTHNTEQVRVAEATDADYVAVGPVFATGSKANPDPVIGFDGVRAARALTRKPLVAIGGITRANFRQVLAAGADSVAVISDLLRDPRHAAQEFLSS